MDYKMRIDGLMSSAYARIDNLRIRQELKNVLQRNLEIVTELLAEAKRHVARINRDDGYTELGRRKQREELANNILKEIKNKTGSLLKTWEANIKEQTEGIRKGFSSHPLLTTDKSDTLLLLDYLKQREIRDNLKNLKEQLKNSPGAEALFNLQVEKLVSSDSSGMILDAILSTMPGFEIVSPEITESLEAKALEAKNPEKYQEIETIKTARDALESIRKTAKAELIDWCDYPRPDPIAELARGKGENQKNADMKLAKRKNLNEQQQPGSVNLGILDDVFERDLGIKKNSLNENADSADSSKQDSAQNDLDPDSDDPGDSDHDKAG